MSDTHKRSFRFCRSEPFKQLQFQPYEHTRMYKGVGKKHVLNSYHEKWCELERSTADAHTAALALTTKLGNSGSGHRPHFHHKEMLAEYYCKFVPVFLEQYVFQSIPKKSATIGKFPVADGAEGDAVAAAVAGNIARRLLLAGNRIHTFKNRTPGRLVTLLDSNHQHWEYKSYLSITLTREGRYCLIDYLFLSVPYDLMFYAKWIPRVGWFSFAPRDCLSSDNGPFTELYEYSRNWMYLMMNYYKGTRQSRGTVADSEFDSYIYEITEHIDRIHNHVMEEVMAGISEVVGIGPSSDVSHQTVL